MESKWSKTIALSGPYWVFHKSRKYSGEVCIFEGQNQGIFDLEVIDGVVTLMPEAMPIIDDDDNKYWFSAIESPPAKPTWDWTDEETAKGNSFKKFKNKLM